MTLYNDLWSFDPATSTWTEVRLAVSPVVALIVPGWVRQRRQNNRDPTHPPTDRLRKAEQFPTGAAATRSPPTLTSCTSLAATTSTASTPTLPALIRLRVRAPVLPGCCRCDVGVRCSQQVLTAKGKRGFAVESKLGAFVSHHLMVRGCDFSPCCPSSKSNTRRRVGRC